MLVDSNEIAVRHWQLWAERRGISFEKVASKHHGRPTVQTMREVAPHLNVESEALQKENAEADDTNGLVAFPGAHRILASIPPERWAIVTSGTRRTATTRLSHTVLPIPNILITADDVANGKPHPEPYLKAIDLLGVHPQKCLVVEDAPAGIQAARTAGTRVIAVATSCQPEELTEADVVLQCLDHLKVSVEGNQLEVVCQPITA